MAAAIRGGFRSVEITMTTPGALELIAELAADSRLIVGAGTVMTPAQANAAVDAGASFVVSPVCDPQVIRAGLERGAALIPGTRTPTEMWAAVQAGATMQKLFPAVSGGPAHIRSLLGPMPFLRLVPTNGVDADNAAAYLEAGAWALGFVTPLFDPELMDRRDYGAIEARARALRAAVDAVERPAVPPDWPPVPV
jgi:Entner-Doudoroff aldolase